MREMSAWEIRATDVQTAKRLLAEEEKDQKIYWFVYHPSVEICSMLLKKHPKFINHLVWSKENVHSNERNPMCPPKWLCHGENALYDACFNGDVEKVKFLIASGADVNAPCAVRLIEPSDRKNVLSMMDRLESRQKIYPLFAAFSYYEGKQGADFAIFKLLLEAGADINCIGWVLAEEKTITEAVRSYSKAIELLKQAGAKE